MKSTNIHPKQHKINKIQRLKLMNQSPKLIWFTGLSGSGKSTLAGHLEQELFKMEYKTYLLDGDNIRTGLNKDLGFSNQDRIENIRRIAEVSNLMLDAGLIVISAFISPFKRDRDLITELVGKDNFLEIYVNCPLEICEKRDVKGLYQKARKGLIKDFTGIDSPYEIPQNPFMSIESHLLEINDATLQVLQKVLPKIK